MDTELRADRGGPDRQHRAPAGRHNVMAIISLGNDRRNVDPMGTGRRHNVMACSERSRPSRHFLRAQRRARAAPVRPLYGRRLATRPRPGSRVAPHPTRPRGSPFTRRWGRPTWFETWGAGGAAYRSGSRRPTWSAAPRVAVRAPTHARVRVPAGEAGSSGRPVPAVRSRHVHAPSPHALLVTPSWSRATAHALLLTPSW